MFFSYPKGSIEVICGPMFAGKTEELIRRVRRLEYAHLNVVILKPMIDDRFSTEEIVSHNNTRIRSFLIEKSSEIMKFVHHETDVVIIDEVQFLDKEVVRTIELLADSGVRVIVAGLDRDFRGEPFGVMSDILALAEDVTKLSAICVKCGAPATRTQRVINGVPAKYTDPIVLVGDTEKYEARCRHCHEVPGKDE